MARKIFAAVGGALLVSLVWASMAFAVTTDYCAYSLRGGGALAPDNDIKRVWDRLERTYGYDVVQSYPIQWYYLANEEKGVMWRFVRAGGYVTDTPFICYGSGSGYHDEEGL